MRKNEQEEMQVGKEIPVFANDEKDEVATYREKGSPKKVPIWQKSNLTLEEAAAYSGIGINKLRKMSDDEGCKFVLWNGRKRLIKRRKLDEYTDKAYSI